MAAVYNLRTRQETLGALDFQVEEKERKRLERERFEREREERVLELSKRFAERRVLASLDVDVVQPLQVRQARAPHACHAFACARQRATNGRGGGALGLESTVKPVPWLRC